MAIIELPETTREILFIYRCCSYGRAFLIDYIKEHPNTSILQYNLFNSIAAGLLDKYSINKDSLLEFAYIIEEDGNVIKGETNGN